MQNFLEGKQNLDAFADNLYDKAVKQVKNIIVETLEEIDKAIKESRVRLEYWVIEQSKEEKSLPLKIGTIRFRRNCYTSKTSGKSVYLLDKIIGLQGHRRMTIGAATSILEETVESSYCKGGKHLQQTNSKPCCSSLTNEKLHNFINISLIVDG